jgi:hypothetical protein
VLCYMQRTLPQSTALNDHGSTVCAFDWKGQMSDTGVSSESSATSKRGVQRGSLVDAEKICGSLWKAARLGSVTPEALAKELSGEKAKASGGAWRNKMALVNVFGLVQKDGAKLKLTPLGQGIVREDDDARRTQSRRSAVLRVEPYRRILASSSGHELPSSTSLAATFEYEYGLTKSDAKKAAEDFVVSAKVAGLVNEADVVTFDVDLANEEEGDSDTGQEGGSSEPRVIVDPIVPDPAAPDPALPDPAALHKNVHISEPGVSRPHVSISVSLDLSSFSADDVVRILGALGVAIDDDKGD